MTKFNPEGKDLLSYGDCLGPAMKITDEQDAQQYLADYIAYIEERRITHPEEAGRHSAEETAKINLGYYAGYYDSETRERVERLFMCAHPIFGKIADHGQPTAEHAHSAGAKMAAG